MIREKIFISIVFIFSLAGYLSAQEKYSPFTENGDSVMLIVLPGVPVYPPNDFENSRQLEQHKRLIRDVKKTLPYAKMIYSTLIETYEYIETLPNKKARQQHLELMEKEMFEQYKPALKKMTLTQGKLLIRLVDRECNQNSYELMKAFLGSFRASFWNFFAGMFGASLKSEWEPEGKDKEAEQIVRLVEAGVI